MATATFLATATFGQAVTVGAQDSAPALNIYYNYGRFEDEKEMLGAILAHVKVAVMNAGNVFYAAACLVADLALTIIAAVAAIFGQGGRNFLGDQLGSLVLDLVAIPASVLGMIAPKAAFKVVEGFQRVMGLGNLQNSPTFYKE
ncbi:MAG: hypothetical protein K940chlam2_01357 [Chlamydiae bacterium]|nr:hypothetical protein [Chlamydiota bacterium]